MAVSSVFLWGLSVGLSAPPSPELLEHLMSMSMHEQAYAQLVVSALEAPTEEERQRYELQAGYILVIAEDWSRAKLHFEHLSLTEAGRLGLAWSLYADASLRPAQDVLVSMEGPQARYLSGWCALQEHQPTQAAAQWQQIPKEDPLYPSAQALSVSVLSWDRIPQRSPAMAGTLSAILPGAGQAYAGYWGEALSALLVNGSLIMASYQLAHRQLWFGFGLVAVVELGFYGGGIVSAAGRARRFNRLAWQKPIDELTEPYGPALTWEGETLQIQ